MAPESNPQTHRSAIEDKYRFNSTNTLNNYYNSRKTRRDDLDKSYNTLSNINNLSHIKELHILKNHEEMDT